MRIALLLTLLFLTACKGNELACGIPRSASEEVCNEQGITCVLPPTTPGWPAFVRTSEGAALPEDWSSILELSLGMNVRSACDAMASLTLMDVETHNVHLDGSDKSVLSAVEKIEFWGETKPVGSSEALKTRIVLSFSQPQSGGALDKISVSYFFLENAPKGTMQEIESGLRTRFGPHSNLSIYERPPTPPIRTYGWIVAGGKIMSGKKYNLCNRENMQSFRRPLFESTTELRETCEVTAEVGYSASLDMQDRPLAIYFTVTDHLRALENWKIDQAALSEMKSTGGE